MSNQYAYIVGVVAKAFGRSAASLRANTYGDRVLQVLAYMLVQFLPRAARYPARNGSTRAAGAQDGNTKHVGRLLKRHASTIRYMCNAVEDRRENAEFDAKLTAIEEELAAAFGTR